VVKFSVMDKGLVVPWHAIESAIIPRPSPLPRHNARSIWKNGWGSRAKAKAAFRAAGVRQCPAKHAVNVMKSHATAATLVGVALLSAAAASPVPTDAPQAGVCYHFRRPTLREMATCLGAHSSVARLVP
jgi:hypothetical protein